MMVMLEGENHITLCYIAAACKGFQKDFTWSQAKPAKLQPTFCFVILGQFISSAGGYIRVSNQY